MVYLFAQGLVLKKRPRLARPVATVPTIGGTLPPPTLCHVSISCQFTPLYLWVPGISVLKSFSCLRYHELWSEAAREYCCCTILHFLTLFESNRQTWLLHSISCLVLLMRSFRLESKIFPKLLTVMGGMVISAVIWLSEVDKPSFSHHGFWYDGFETHHFPSVELLTVWYLSTAQDRCCCCDGEINERCDQWLPCAWLRPGGLSWRHIYKRHILLQVVVALGRAMKPKHPSTQPSSSAPPWGSHGIPRPEETCNPSSVSGLLLVGCAWNASKGRGPGGLLTRCLYHLSWLLSMR